MPLPASDFSLFQASEPAVPQSVPKLRRGVATVSSRLNLDRAVRDGISLAVTEACSNVVLHAYREEDSEGTIEVSAWVESGELVVMVSDRGCGMKARLDSPGLGMGLPLIASVCDTIQFTDRPDGGVAVRMRFAISA